MLLRKSRYGFEIDIWSFGCLLIEMILGETLFYAENEIELLLNIFQVVGSPQKKDFSVLSDECEYMLLPQWKKIDWNTSENTKIKNL